MNSALRARAPEIERLKSLARAAQRGLATGEDGMGCEAAEAVYALSLALAESVRQADAHLPDVLNLVSSMYSSMERSAIVAGAAPEIAVVGPEAFERLAKKVGI